MNNSSEIVDIKKTYLAIATMLMAILCVDLYMVVIKFLGNEYTVFKKENRDKEAVTFLSKNRYSTY